MKNINKNLILITGGARSGKSRLAQNIAAKLDSSVLYIATMHVLAGDQEQKDRIDRHRADRPREWETIESPYKMAATISKIKHSVVVIDCLSVYVSNAMIGMQEEGVSNPYARQSYVEGEVEKLLQEIGQRKDTTFVVVTNEVGWGVVPETPLGRAFRDFLGNANQRFAAQADEVWLTCSGLPLRLKPTD